MPGYVVPGKRHNGSISNLTEAKNLFYHINGKIFWRNYRLMIDGQLYSPTCLLDDKARDIMKNSFSKEASEWMTQIGLMMPHCRLEVSDDESFKFDETIKHYLTGYCANYFTNISMGLLCNGNGVELVANLDSNNYRVTHTKISEIVNQAIKTEIFFRVPHTVILTYWAQGEKDQKNLSEDGFYIKIFRVSSVSQKKITQLIQEKQSDADKVKSLQLQIAALQDQVMMIERPKKGG